MSLSARRLRSIGWLALLAVCTMLVLVLTLRVNALRSQVRREENRIVALREETMYLQTEFETRASQQQLKAWNNVEFGYVAPAAGQYLENERQLAMLGKPDAPDAPAPVRLAELGDDVGGQATSGSYPAMVSPLTGRPAGESVRSDAVARGEGAGRMISASASAQSGQDRPAGHDAAAAALGERLGSLDHGQAAKPGKHDRSKLAQPRKHGPEAKAATAKPKSKPKPKPKAKPKSSTNATPKPAHAKPASGPKPKPHTSEARR